MTSVLAVVLGSVIGLLFTFTWLSMRQRFEDEAQTLSLIIARLDRIDRELELYGRWFAQGKP